MDPGISRRRLIASAAGLLAPLAAKAAFKDPLDEPARQTALAPTERMTAIALAGPRLVAAGRLGRIVWSDDGTRWQQAEVPVSSDLTALHFPKPGIGWAVGHDGVVLQSSDGGRRWVRQLDTRMLAAQRPATAASSAKPADEGERPFLDVCFLDEREGFAVGAFNLALRTLDGGRSWQSVSERTANDGGLHLYSLSRGADGLYLAGEQGLLRRWDAREQRFVALDSPYKGTFFGIAGRGDTLLAYGLAGTLFSSRDAGRSWTKVDTGANASIVAGAAAPSAPHFFLATQAGSLLRHVPGEAGVKAYRPQRPMPYAGLTALSGDRVALAGFFGVSIERVAGHE